MTDIQIHVLQITILSFELIIEHSVSWRYDG